MGRTVKLQGDLPMLRHPICIVPFCPSSAFIDPLSTI
jgi:hypothetical protein